MICVEIVSHNSREPLGSSGLWLTIETQIIQNLYGQHFEVIIDYISRQNSPETFEASDGYEAAILLLEPRAVSVIFANTYL